MKQSIMLTKTEEKLMDLFWEKNEPLTVVKIMDATGEKYWSYNSLHMMLRSLKAKGLIEECGKIRYVTKYANIFQYKLTREEYYAKLLLEKGITRDGIIDVTAAFLCEEQPEQEELIEKLKKVVGS